MRLPQILTLARAIIGVTLIVLSIVAVCSPTWIVLTTLQTIEATYDLFGRCDKPLIDEAMLSEGCTTISNLQTAQGLIIAGIAVVEVGIIIASPLDTLLENNRWIKSAPQMLLIAGPTLILVGLLFYIMNILGNFTEGSTKLDLGYSFILISVTCIIGYISAAYFLFATGFVHGYRRARLTLSQEANGKQ